MVRVDSGMDPAMRSGRSSRFSSVNAFQRFAEIQRVLKAESRCFLPPTARYSSVERVQSPFEASEPSHPESLLVWVKQLCLSRWKDRGAESQVALKPRKILFFPSFLRFVTAGDPVDALSTPLAKHIRDRHIVCHHNVISSQLQCTRKLDHGRPEHLVPFQCHLHVCTNIYLPWHQSLNLNSALHQLAKHTAQGPHTYPFAVQSLVSIGTFEHNLGLSH